MRIREEITGRKSPLVQVVSNESTKCKRRQRRRGRARTTKKISPVPLQKKPQCKSKDDQKDLELLLKDVFVTSQEESEIRMRVKSKYKQLPQSAKKEVDLSPTWMNEETVAKCRNLSTFSDPFLNQMLSRLILYQSSFRSAVKITMACLWSRKTLQSHYIPPSLSQVSDVQVVPYYQMFHKIWRFLEPENDPTSLAKYRRNFSSYISAANKNVRDSSRNTTRGLNRPHSGHPLMSQKSMDQMKVRCKQLLQSIQSPNPSKSPIEYEWSSAIHKSCKISRFFPDQELNRLLSLLIVQSASLWLAIRDTALVFWPKELFKTHYLPCPQSRTSGKPQVEGASVFHQFWSNLVPDEKFRVKFVEKIRKLGHSLSSKRQNLASNAC